MTTGNGIVDEVLKINISGNVIPMSWYKTITRESGKPYLEAITILSDIVYWYKPSEVRDETSGELIGYKKKFKSDLLQRSYQQLSNMFGISKREATNAVVRLEQLGVVKRVFRTLTVNDVVTSNVLFLELNPMRLKELTYPETAAKSEEEIAITFKSDTPHFQKGEPPLSKVTRNTKITTKITTKTTNVLNKSTHISKKESNAKTEKSVAEVSNVQKTKRESFDEIIERYANGNERLELLLKQLLQIRFAKKRVTTNVVLNQLLDKLSELARSDKAKIKVLENSILKGYPDVYELSKEELEEVHWLELREMQMERPEEWEEYMQFLKKPIKERSELLKHHPEWRLVDPEAEAMNER